MQKLVDYASHATCLIQMDPIPSYYEWAIIWPIHMIHKANHIESY